MKKWLYKYSCIFFALILIFVPSIFASNSDFKIYSSSAIAVDASSGITLYSKNADKKIYPASTTKIITAILAIENLDLNQKITVSNTAIKVPWDSSSIYLKEGEIITVDDLLYGLLLASR